MNKLYIILLSFTLLFLVLGITFAILKSNNDEYLKSNPEIKNNNSDTYLGLSITFFVLFLGCLLYFLFYFLFPKNKLDKKNENYKPIMSYNTPPRRESTDKDITPQSDNTPYQLRQNIKAINRKIDEFPSFREKV